MSDDSPTEVKASPPTTDDAGRAPGEARGKPRPAGRLKRTLKDVADWAADSEFVDWVVEKILTGVLFVLGIAALLLVSQIDPGVVDSVTNWIANHDADNAFIDIVTIGLVLVVVIGAIVVYLWRAASWLAGKISARRAARARRATDRQGDMAQGCHADHRADDDPGVGVDLAPIDRGSAERWITWIVFAVLLGAALFLLRRPGDRSEQNERASGSIDQRRRDRDREAAESSRHCSSRRNRPRVDRAA
jgi:hypothetical protein